ncbi:MAG: mercury methylation corrinoid protein HgcA [Anaerolineae bacterium]
MSVDAPGIRRTTSQITFADHWQHVLTRLGYRRDQQRVQPGLYALGRPTPQSPVLVTANYRLSFDALREALAGRDAYILVLNTYGINVWCAAGKGTFGTDELVRRIEDVQLHDVVAHRRLILPQLGAPGVSAHLVKQRSGFAVEYGPVRAVDLPVYLETRQATPAMRRVRFDLADRAVLIPIEVVHAMLPAAAVCAILWLLGSPLAAMGVLTAVLAATVLFPVLLPWLPARTCTAKGLLLGGAVGLAFAALAWQRGAQSTPWLRAGRALSLMLALPPVTAYLALNFTGSTTFTSRTGVRFEIARYVPWLAGLLVSGLLLTGALTIVHWLGGR